MKRIFYYILLLWILMIESIFPVQPAQNKEYLVKTAYIEKFARFTEWPAESNHNNFIIGVIGKSQFGGALELLAEKYKIRDKKIRIRYYASADEISNCNILIICSSEKSRINTILNSVERKPILTVGDTKGFAQRGVHFNFYVTDEGTIHFEVNPSKISESGLKCDMLLLGVGKIIE